jgi:glutaredoxin
MMFQIFTVPDCKWCTKAKELASDMGYEIEELDFYGLSMWEWEQLIGKVPATAPQILVNGEYIGGCVDFMKWIEN